MKRFVSGVVYAPVTLRPDQTLDDAKALQERYRITGFPVVDEQRRRASASSPTATCASRATTARRSAR